MKVQGLYTALVTPFNDKGDLDSKRLRDLLQFQLTHGVDGIVVLGTTGESPTLSRKEQDEIISIASEEVRGKIPLVVGTGSYSTQQTILNCKRAKQLGANAVLIVTPYYNKPTQEGIFLHFKAIVEAVDIPILIYNIQGR